jgi:HD-GYP domain-containing protein (c-di-GMP phosphodiesterase class II)
MGITLRQLTREMVSIAQPLRWDIFSSQGQLLLHRGYVVQSASQLESLLDRGMYVNAAEIDKPKLDSKKAADFDPFILWDDLSKNCSRLNTAYLKAPPDQLLTILDDVLSEMEALVEKAPDAAIFEMIQMDLSNYVVAHNQQTAFLSTLIATRLGWPPKKIRTVSRAAATMNIAALQLHTVLALQKEPITDLQRAEMRTHGARGRQVLEELGVQNKDWLQAVEEHHPDVLTSGRKPSDMADLIHHADVYLAKISPRAYRAAKPPNVAAKEMVQRKHANAHYVATIVKEIGVYPPGSYVKLANGETAVVTRRGKQAHTPIVFSLANGAGLPLMEPVLRDTSSPLFAVSSIVPKSKVMVTINRAKLFGSERNYRAFG